MLVLSRKINQSIVIGDNIEIMLVDIRGDQIKLGINAPKNVSVYREELYREIKQNNISSQNVSESSVNELAQLLIPKENTLNIVQKLTNKISD